MSWTRYLMHDFFTARALNEKDEEIDHLRAANRSRRRRESALKERVADLEDTVGRMSLLLGVLVEVGLRKGTFDEAELDAEFDRLDLRDGVRDGKLDPEWLDQGPAPE